MKTLHPLSITTVRRLAVTKQYLQQHKTPMLDVIRALGCVQIDPISAVERTQYLTLWSRLGQYDRADFDALAYQERAMFEYWAHAASYVLTEDYPVHRWQMHNWRNPQGNGAWSRRQRELLEEHQDLRQHILHRLREEGPLPSREFKDDRLGQARYSGWTSPRLVSRMFDHLWSAGHILVSHRTGTQRYWDISERVLPIGTPDKTLTANEVTAYAAEKAIRALGVATSAQIKQHFTRGRYPELANTLKHMVKAGVLHRVDIHTTEGQPLWKQPAYIHSDDLPMLEQIEAGEWHPRTVLLSPFDNLICDRNRTEQLWDFRYRIEIYVPKAKREYGYYVLPILHGDQLIGRVDPTMDRNTGTLHINNVYHEANAPDHTEAVQAIREAILSLAQFLGAERINYTGQIPAQWAGISS